jgi:penicillin amidase
MKCTNCILYLVALIATLAVVSWQTAKVLFLPRTTGSINLKTARGQADIFRDEQGIVSIYSESLAMTVYAQGFVHAQDRLWQMEKQRRLCTGRLAELFGEEVVEMDITFRHMGFKHLSSQIMKTISKEEKDILEAYADGVNAFVSKVGLLTEDNSAHLLPPEFYAFNIEWQPWTPEDSISSLKLLNFHLSWDWGN